MKKKCVNLYFSQRSAGNLLKKMKLLIAFFFTGLLGVSASTYSQKTKLSLKLDEVTVKEAFKSIEKNSEFVFFYNEDYINVYRKVNIDVVDEKIEFVLNEILKGTQNTFNIFDRQIVILPPERKESPLILKSTTEAEQKKELYGTVKDNKGLPLPGVSVVIKGTTIGINTDIDGNFRLSVPLDAKIIVFSFIGMKSQEFPIAGKTTFNVILEEAVVGLDEVVAVGYGVQKKASVVGAITTTTSKELERTGGVTNLAQALTGNLPGLMTIQTSGKPGNDDPIIYIRGQSTWNGGQPYILVDGVERRMNDLDISEVDNISILKDASATAVYGVKGANGVILITTKRGSKGKPTLSISANSTLRMPTSMVSKEKLDSYNTLLIKNEAIEHEVAINEAEWRDYTPLTIVDRYRNQQNLKYPEAYPNIDWQKTMFKKTAMNHRVNLNVAGGTDFVKYFTSLAYMHEADLLKSWDNGKGYKPGLGYDRFNFRTNLDLNLTRTTLLKFNLAGVYGITKDTYNIDINTASQLLVASNALPPNAFMPRYSDGRWGYSPSGEGRYLNSATKVANSGIRQIRKTDLTSDLTLTQKLDFITNGLSISGSVSFDNHFESSGGIYESQNNINALVKWIDPAIEDMPVGGNPNDYITLGPTSIGTNQFNFVLKPWTRFMENAATSVSTLRRRLYYKGQMDYARTFGKHNVTGTGVFTREQLATGSEFQRYREDWIFRATYNYDNRYFAEFNGAYNGSEKFGPGYRFAFFPSVAAGWTISNEKIMKGINWLNNLKLRYSYGLIGDDGGISQRWLYSTQWSYANHMPLGQYALTQSPYTWYSESMIGNPEIHWEKALKSNLGLEVSVLKNMFSANVDYFTEDRTDILLVGSSRILPAYFGGIPTTGNVGRVKKNGYEVELRFNKNLQNWHLWANTSVTHAIDKILYKEEPMLKDPHLLAQGFQINQTKSLISGGFINTWDQMYASVQYSNSDNQKLPGSYFIIDFDGNGVLDVYDNAPYGYSTRQQNTFNATLGIDYKGFSCMAQFYGVNNVTSYVTFENFVTNIDLAYAHALDHWSKDNPNASSFLPTWKNYGLYTGNYFQFDGSYLRLKTAEIAYTFSGARLKHAGMSSLKLYLNGGNLIFWSKLPYDREQESGTYPTSKNINLGVDIKF